VRTLAARFQVPFAGEVDFEPGIEDALGSPARLAATRAAPALMAALRAIDLAPDAERDS
jgi:hypothetical protein